ncbi:lipopolysaccharide biosynthesis protein [Tsuneonella suprasediminis]|uniref:lipopolysaccharide biosynthesis protein n=1 Tax=Tsuneonella suprasediminis TaxID=2306996 RepID=UPI001403F8E1|nr:oligosaccharide flippase family protein [Tsuneonella suprasediminis]
MEDARNRIINITLRFGTLGSRFLLIFFLAKFLSPAEVGNYGLFTAAVGYTLYIVGLDFYVFTTREIVHAPAKKRGHFLKTQICISAIIYLVVAPASLVVLSKLGWSSVALIAFLPILVLEHFNQEIMRLLIALSEQITASIILFLRQGSWAIASVLLMALDPSSRLLWVVLGLWFLGGALAAIIGVWKVASLKMGGWHDRIDWSWARRGLKVSFAFLIATLALRAIQTLDRFWIEALGGVEVVAAYVLFTGVASSMMVFLDAGVFAFTYPALIRHHKHGDREAFQRVLRKSLLQTILFIGAFSVVSLALLPYLLAWIGKAEYLSKVSLFPWILSALALNCLGMIPHYALYACSHDRSIIASHIIALAVFTIAAWALGHAYGTLAIPIALNLAFLSILIFKSLAYWALQPHPQYQQAA